jgi:hypothetical protein
VLPSSVSVATKQASPPVACQLYLPESWKIRLSQPALNVVL